MINWYEENYPPDERKSVCIIKSKGEVIGRINRDDVNFNKILRNLVRSVGNWEMEYEDRKHDFKNGSMV